MDYFTYVILCNVRYLLLLLHQYMTCQRVDVTFILLEILVSLSIEINILIFLLSLEPNNRSFVFADQTVAPMEKI